MLDSKEYFLIKVTAVLSRCQKVIFVLGFFFVFPSSGVCSPSHTGGVFFFSRRGDS